ncbi:ribonuclease domain-containing protein [Streptomyces sp. NPDC093094]|uniref:ribonuclease domain-containing protein n=1 Tax=Streptomyces sp. NPDC093094 TaxID=3366026 RepID=UPI0037F406FA
MSARPARRGCPGANTPAGAPSRAGDTAVVRAADLPGEARDTLDLVDRGGPFPYDRDGAVSGNFERLPPAHERGDHHEYTVRTPRRAGDRPRGVRARLRAHRGPRPWRILLAHPA